MVSLIGLTTFILLLNSMGKGLYGQYVYAVGIFSLPSIFYKSFMPFYVRFIPSLQNISQKKYFIRKVSFYSLVTFLSVWIIAFYLIIKTVSLEDSVYLSNIFESMSLLIPYFLFETFTFLLSTMCSILNGLNKIGIVVLIPVLTAIFNLVFFLLIYFYNIENYLLPIYFTYLKSFTALFLLLYILYYFRKSIYRFTLSKIERTYLGKDFRNYFLPSLFISLGGFVKEKLPIIFIGANEDSTYFSIFQKTFDFINTSINTFHSTVISLFLNMEETARRERVFDYSFISYLCFISFALAISFLVPLKNEEYINFKEISFMPLMLMFLTSPFLRVFHMQNDYNGNRLPSLCINIIRQLLFIILCLLFTKSFTSVILIQTTTFLIASFLVFIFSKKVRDVSRKNFNYLIFTSFILLSHYFLN